MRTRRRLDELEDRVDALAEVLGAMHEAQTDALAGLRAVMAHMEHRGDPVPQEILDTERRLAAIPPVPTGSG